MWSSPNRDGDRDRLSGAQSSWYSSVSCATQSFHHSALDTLVRRGLRPRALPDTEPRLTSLGPSRTHGHVARVPGAQERTASEKHITRRLRIRGISPHFIVQYIHVSSCICKGTRSHSG